MKQIIFSSLLAGACGLLCSSFARAETEPTSAIQQPQKKLSGIDQSLFSESVEPGQSFYQYANEQWLEETKIPSDKSNYGIFTVLGDRTREQVRELIEAAAEEDAEKGTPAQKVGDLYESVLDLQTRNEAGIEPIRPLLEEVDGIESAESFATTLAKLARKGVYGPMAAYVAVDARKSDQYAVYLTQSGLTMPDRDYYLEDEERYRELRSELKSYIADLLKRAGVEQPKQAAKSVFDIEAMIAQAQWTKTENRDPEKTYNKYSGKELMELLAPFPWRAFAKAAGFAGRDYYIVRQPSYFEELAAQGRDVSLDAWKHYLTFRVLDAYASSLSESLEKRHFDFHSTELSGISVQEDLWKRGVGVVGSATGELVGQLYVEEHFSPEAKRRMNELVDNLKLAFEKRIASRDWMSEGTKKQAQEKLSMITTKIGYPDEWKDYSNLEITDGPLAENMLAAANFEYERDLGKLDGPVDRKEWHMTPQTVNAYYNPTMNEIVFPAAILQPPFFNMAADDAVNYGGIGAVIGHELSHAFDDKGSKFDGKGNLRNWWTESDRVEFERRAEGLVDQYGQFEPVEGKYLNGELTLGENIGDLGGLSVAHEAYRLSLEEEPAPVIDELTGDQRFFLGWSQIWRRKYRPAELQRRLLVDPHSPSEYRVDGVVRNMDAWYDAFDVDADDPLFLDEEERVRIW